MKVHSTINFNETIQIVIYHDIPLNTSMNQYKENRKNVQVYKSTNEYVHNNQGINMHEQECTMNNKYT